MDRFNNVMRVLYVSKKCCCVCLCGCFVTCAQVCFAEKKLFVNYPVKLSFLKKDLCNRVYT